MEPNNIRKLSAFIGEAG